MPPGNPDHETIQEMYRLARENNRMLRAMRRNAFFGGIVKFLLYAAFLILPIWFYQQYLSATVTEIQRSLQQMQGTGTQAQQQLTSLEDALKKVGSFVPAAFKPQQATSSVH